MGFLNKTSEITLDAVITRKGRQYLAEAVLGDHIIIDPEGNERTIPVTNKHKITKFALGDDEIDYSLWDMTPDSNDVVHYGAVIENIPLTEANFNDSEIMNNLLYKHGMNVEIIESSLPIPILNSVTATLGNLAGESVYTINIDWNDIDGFSAIDGDVYRIFVNNIFKQDFSISFANTSDGRIWGVYGGNPNIGGIDYSFRVSYYNLAKDKESTWSNPIILTLESPGNPPSDDVPNGPPSEM